jgi:hypothetical protein
MTDDKGESRFCRRKLPPIGVGREPRRAQHMATYLAKSRRVRAVVELVYNAALLIDLLTRRHPKVLVERERLEPGSGYQNMLLALGRAEVLALP